MHNIKHDLHKLTVLARNSTQRTIVAKNGKLKAKNGITVNYFSGKLIRLNSNTSKIILL